MGGTMRSYPRSATPSACFVPIISANTEREPEGYVFQEWEEAADRLRRIPRRRFIVPVIVDDDYDGDPSRFRQIPTEFKRFHFGRAPGGRSGRRPAQDADRPKSVLCGASMQRDQQRRRPPSSTVRTRGRVSTRSRKTRTRSSTGATGKLRCCWNMYSTLRSRSCTAGPAWARRRCCGRVCSPCCATRHTPVANAYPLSAGLCALGP